MTCNTISFVSQLIRKCFRRKFLDLFGHKEKRRIFGITILFANSMQQQRLKLTLSEIDRPLDLVNFRLGFIWVRLTRTGWAADQYQYWALAAEAAGDLEIANKSV